MWLRRKILRRPPQPFTLPLIGNLYLLPQPGELPGVHKAMMKHAKSLGPVMGFWFGGVYTVIISNWKAAYEALKVREDDFAGRFCPDAITYITKGKGIAMQNNLKVWQKARTLLQTGLTRKDVQGDAVVGVMLEEIHSTCKEFYDLAATGGHADVKVRAYFGRESLNVYMRQMISVRFSEKMTPTYQDVRLCLEEIFKRISAGNPADFISVLKLAGRPKILDEMEMYAEKMYVHIRGYIKDHKERLARGEPPRDFLDEMLIKHKDYDLDEVDVEVIVWDVLAGGIDTTATTMEWLAYIMVNYPETQRKVQAELDEVVGPNRLPTFKDRPNLPYLNAVILELMRWKHFAPFGLPHMTLNETEVMGYKIPRGAQVLVNFTAVHMDPNVWKKPEEWRPERFLEEEKALAMAGPNGIHDAFFGDVKPNEETHKFIPFGAGKRKCTGVGIGRVVMWCKVATYLHCFNFESPTGKKLNIDDEWFGVTIMPEEQTIRVKNRPAGKLLKSVEHTYDGTTL